MLCSPFLPSGVGPPPHWVPTSYVSPCFTHIQSEGTARCLSRTQVALHLQKAHLDSLAAESKNKEAGWDKQRADLEDRLRSLAVRNMEAERLFKIQEKHLDNQLERTEGKLEELEKDHRDLKDTSAEKLAQLRGDCGELQRRCDELEHERQGLKRQLGDADVTAAARRAADKKVQILEDAIAGLKQRTQRTIDDLQRKKDQAESSRDLFWRHYMGADQERKKEEQARQASEQRAHEMTQDWRRLEAALALERLINQPLRHTDHTTTTTSHVLSSLAAPVVADCCRDPSGPPPTWPVPDSSVTTSSGAAPEPGSYLDRLQQLTQKGQHASSFLYPELDEKGRKKQAAGTSQGAVRPSSLRPQQQRSDTPPLLEPLRHDDLTRLSRAWATTTPTAGFPHPQFLDNEARFKKSYQAVYDPKSRSRPSSKKKKGIQLPSQAVRDAYHELPPTAGRAAARPARR